MSLNWTKGADGTGLFNINSNQAETNVNAEKHMIEIETPCAFLYTSCGVVPHLTNETVTKLQRMPSVGVLSLSTLSEYSDVISEMEGGAPMFTRLDQICPVTLCVGNDALQVPPKKSSKKAVIVRNRGGNMQLSPQDYNKMQSVFKCDIQQSELVSKPSIADDDNTGETRSKEASFRKNKTFLEEFLKLAHGDSKRILVSAPYDCTKTIKWIFDNKASQVSGISLATPSVLDWNEEHLLLIAQCVELIPSHIPIMVPGPLDPLVVCNLSNIGISLFDTSYTVIVTARGGALCFPLELTGDLAEMDRFYELDLEQDKYSDRSKPVMSSCTCTTCMKFTQAYLNHLLKTKEMLARVLLMIHNLHHYMIFMETVRQFMKDRTLGKYIKALEALSSTKQSSE